LTVLNKISEHLKKDINQRLLYGIGLLIWAIIWFDDLKYYNAESSIGIKYLWLITIPTILLIGQILFNRKILWIIIVGLISSYSIWTLWEFLFHNVLIDHHKDYIPKKNWPFTDLIAFLFLFILLFSMNWPIWKMKPKK